MTEEDVADLIDSHAAEPSVKELIQLQEDDKAGDDDDDDDVDDNDTKTRPVFTIKKLRHLLKEAENLTALFTDPYWRGASILREMWMKALCPTRKL